MSDPLDIFVSLLRSKEFWLALWAFAQAIILYALPDFPKEILIAANALVGVIVSVLTGAAVSRSVAARRAARAAAADLSR